MSDDTHELTSASVADVLCKLGLLADGILNLPPGTAQATIRGIRKFTITIPPDAVEGLGNFTIEQRNAMTQASAEAFGDSVTFYGFTFS